VLREKPLKRSTPELTRFARQLRVDQTDAEKKLWRVLRSRQFENTKFKRQIPFPPYVVDFYCHSARLVIEIDGSQHFIEVEADERRTRFLERRSLTVIRFTNLDVLANLEGVTEVILQELNGVNARTLPPPS
jgi:very-short-patch-repair endonuclease